jgi:hypothetical protein
MGGDASDVKTTADLHPLCYEHHVEMKPLQIYLDSNIDHALTLAYACPEAGCVIYYNSPSGYFMPSVPNVVCPRHGLPMYLAEVKTQNRSFRLWRCPEVGCSATRTNEDHLVGLQTPSASTGYG